MSGITSSKASSMTQLISGANISAHELCEMKTFSAFNLTPLMHILFCISCLLILWTVSECYCVKCSRISQISVSCLSQGSSATRPRCDGQSDMGFVLNSSENTTVKEFWKSVNICESYRLMYSGTVFLTHSVYSELPTEITEVDLLSCLWSSFTL